MSHVLSIKYLGLQNISNKNKALNYKNWELPESESLNFDSITNQKCYIKQMQDKHLKTIENIQNFKIHKF